MIYAKTWCPAYPCDPCLVRSGSLITDNIGSDPQNGIIFCPGQDPALPSGNYLNVINYYEGVDTSSYFHGVRKWGLAVQVVPGSDPRQFSLPVAGIMARASAPLPLSDLTITYSGLTVLTVSGSVKILTQGPPQAPYPDGTQLINFTGYIELPSDAKCIQIAPGSLYNPAGVWEFHYDGPVYDSGPVSLQYRQPVQHHYSCAPLPLWPHGWQYELSTALNGLPQVAFYRTQIDELRP
jgi:hypothetical protein